MLPYFIETKKNIVTRLDEFWHLIAHFFLQK